MNWRILLTIIFIYCLPHSVISQTEYCGNVVVISGELVRINVYNNTSFVRDSKLYVLVNNIPIAELNVISQNENTAITKIVEKTAEFSKSSKVGSGEHYKQIWDKSKLYNKAEKLEQANLIKTALSVYQNINKLYPADKIAGNKIKELEFRTGQKVSLIVKSDPANSKIYIDNRLVSTSSQYKHSNFASTNHFIKIIPADPHKFETHSMSFNIYPFKSTQLNISLKYKLRGLPSRKDYPQKQKLVLSDIGQTRSEYHYVKKNNPAAGVLWMIIGGAMVSAGFKSDKSDTDTEEDTEDKKKKGLTGSDLIGGLGVVTFIYGIMQITGKNERVGNPKNKTYNNRLRATLNKRNAEIDKYNRNMNEKYIEDLEEVRAYNRKIEAINRKRKAEVKVF